jgi:hypothetical protein
VCIRVGVVPRQLFLPTSCLTGNHY